MRFLSKEEKPDFYFLNVNGGKFTAPSHELWPYVMQHRETCRSPWEMCFELKSIVCQITGESLENEHI